MTKIERISGALRLLVYALFLYGLAFTAAALYRRGRRAAVLETGKSSYLHYEFIDVHLKTPDSLLTARWKRDPPRAVVLRGGRPVATVAGLKWIALSYDPGRGEFSGRWPCPWNAPTGRYDLRLLAPKDVQRKLRARPFWIAGRKPRPLPRGFAVLTLESLRPLPSVKVRAPDGKMKDWRGMLDWAQFIGADAFWMLGARSPGEKSGEIWTSVNRAMLPQVARACHKRGLKFGVYVLCYLTNSKNRLARYRYALDAAHGRTVLTRAISLDDPRRPGDIAAILKKFSEIPGVDFLGIDYIRNALGGYELADDFYSDMPGMTPPPSWDRLSSEERSVYLARKKIMRRDWKLTEAWQWWRAHKVALIVHQIKTRLDAPQPLWAFTLSWEKGWQHGQDSVMINDAGADIDAVMLYEATRPQFDALLGDWHRYLRHGNAQVIPGDVVDWNLHQKSPDGPEEFYRRDKEAVDRIYGDGPAPGLFIHDMGRALWGRTGVWGTKGWMEAAKRAIAYMRARNGLEPPLSAPQIGKGKLPASPLNRILGK